MMKLLLPTLALALAAPLAITASAADAGANKAENQWIEAKQLSRGVRKLDRLVAGVSVKNGFGLLEDLGYKILPAKKEWFDDLYTAPDSPFRAPTGAVSSMARSFYINNPLTLYGSVIVPTQDVISGDIGYDKIYNIDGDDAILLFGRTPPDITYYSFVMNQFDTYYQSEGDYQETNSSIGLTINQGNIKAMGGGIHNSFFTMLIGSNRNTLDLIGQFLVDLGIPATLQNELLVPERFTRFNTNTPDHLLYLTRLTFRTQAELDLILGYINADPAPIRALFFNGPGGPGDILDEDLTQWEDTLRDNSDEWDALADQDLEILGNRIKQANSAQGYNLLQEGSERLRHVKPQAWCRDVVDSTCNFDAPDALYGVFQCGENGESCNFPLTNEEDQVYIVGVNHHAYAGDTLGTYFSYAVTRMTDLKGVAAIPDLELEGSAAAWVEGTGLDPDNYFVIKVSRDCTGDPYCMEVPYLLDGGVGPNQPVRVSSRVYLDKITHSAPNPESFVPAKLLWFVKP